MKRQWGLIVFGVLLCVVLGFIYYHKTQPLYRSEAQLFIIERNATAMVDPGASYFRSVQDSILSSHLVILQSSQILSEAYHSLKAENNPHLSHLYSQGNAVNYIKANLKTIKGGEGKLKSAMVLVVSFSSPSPQESEAVLSAVVKAYMDYVEKEYSDPTKLVAKLHEESKIDFENQLKKIRKDMMDFRMAHPDYMVISGTSTTTQHLLSKCMDERQTLNGKLTDLKTRWVSLERITDLMNSSGNESDIIGAILANIDSDSVYESLKDMIKGDFFPNTEVQRIGDHHKFQLSVLYTALLNKRMELQNLAEDVVGTEAPLVKRTEQSITVLENMLESIKQQEQEVAINPFVNSIFDMVKVLTNKTNESIITLEAQLQEVQVTIDQLEQKLRAHGVLELEYQNFLAQRSFTEDMIRQISQKLEDIAKIQTSVGLNVDQIEPPRLAERPIWPSFKIIFGLALIVGVGLGSTLAYLVDLMDRTFHSPAEIGSMVGAPVLAHLPRLHAMHHAKHEWPGSPKMLGFIAPEIVTHHKPKSPESEVFRGLRTSLLVGMKMRNQTVLQVTSTKPHEGKTTISTNLAVSIANSNRRVLLVDGDLRSPSLHSIFGIVNGTGFSNYLHKEKQFDDILQTTPVENLTLVTAGTNCENPAEILSSPLFKKFLSEAKEKFDFIILDTPPVLAVSDTGIMAAETDNILMAVRVMKNGRPSVMKAAYMLREVGANICGIAVNTFQSHRFYSTHNGSDEGYGYGYGFKQYYSSQRS